MSNSKFEGPIWKTGTKDGSVYFEIWTCDNITRLVDGDLLPEVAYNIGKSLMDNAIKQGYVP